MAFIVIVGGLGYIGSHTSLELLKAGYNITIIDNLSNSYESAFDRIEALARQYNETECQPMPQMRFHEVDYRDESSMRDILDQYIEDKNDSPRPSAASRKSRGSMG
jgi:UDP-glucose 4-epimerase